jgi:hypothetical protein
MMVLRLNYTNITVRCFVKLPECLLNVKQVQSIRECPQFLHVLCTSILGFLSKEQIKIKIYAACA